MKILIINSVCGIRSTGRICTDIAEQYIRGGHECRIAYGREQVPEKYEGISYRIGNEFSVRINALEARLFDNEGFNAKRETKRFLNWADSYNPDVLWLHNLHGYYLNLEMLFEWIKKRPQMEVKWTLHDCWAFTGHCAHFSFVKCAQWETGCYACNQKKAYPESLLIDRSKRNYENKKNLFTNVNNMTLIVPSFWMASLVEKSFLKDYPIEITYNEIDYKIFRPTESDFRERHKLKNKIIILGVATAWSDRKGLLDFVELSSLLKEPYKIVLVGLDNNQMFKLPKNILCLKKTNNKKELAEIYTAADIFLNLSYEETFGLTTLEALACNTPTIVYKNTACEEIANLYGGVVVEQKIEAILEAIYDIANRKQTCSKEGAY